MGKCGNRGLVRNKAEKPRVVKKVDTAFSMPFFLDGSSGIENRVLNGEDSSLFSWLNSLDCGRTMDAADIDASLTCAFEGGATNAAWHEAAYMTDAMIVVLHALDAHNDHDRDRLPVLLDVMVDVFIFYAVEIFSVESIWTTNKVD